MLLVTRLASIIRIRRDIISSLTETFLKISPADSDWTDVTDTFRAIKKNLLLSPGHLLFDYIRNVRFHRQNLSIHQILFLFLS